MVNINDYYYYLYIYLSDDLMNMYVRLSYIQLYNYCTTNIFMLTRRDLSVKT